MSLKHLSSSFIFAILFVLTKYIQLNLFEIFRIGLNSSAFYLPAGVALFSILIVHYYSAFSLLVGATIAYYFIVPNNDFMTSLTKGSFYAVGGFVTALILDKVFPKFNGFTKPKADLKQLDAYDILTACLIYSVITNLIFRTYFVYFLEIEQSLTTFLLRLFGDFSGSFLVFIGLNLSFIVFKILKIRFGRTTD